MRPFATVEQFMTPSPHTIGSDQTLATAHRVMRHHRIRHLPVLEGGRLVGIVSQRDLTFVEGLTDVDPESIAVSEAMTTEILAAEPTADVRDVAARMAQSKSGSIVVMQGRRVVGIFTTVDALKALVTLLDQDRAGCAP